MSIFKQIKNLFITPKLRRKRELSAYQNSKKLELLQARFEEKKRGQR